MARILLMVIGAAVSLAAASVARADADPAAAAFLLAVGDIASCDSTHDEATARVTRASRGVVAVLGDAVYERGTRAEFARCYAPSWGAFRERTRAALGNHEYASRGAAPARAYFGLPPSGWYAYSLGTWRVIVLNSNCGEIGGCGRGSRQWGWLRGELARNPARCMLAYWHHPRWSSGIHGSNEAMDDLWRLLARAHADLVLAGHDHHYERFAPIDGIRSFVVGTGGRSHVPYLRRIARSEAANWMTYGVLRLTLRRGGYTWRFLPVAGRSFTDAGSDRCR
jgi:acid phosphatase type 7